MKRMSFTISMIFLFAFPACDVEKPNPANEPVKEVRSGIAVANLEATSDLGAFAEIKARFRTNNVGYDLEWYQPSYEVRRSEHMRALFVQTGGGTAKVSSGNSSKISVGDIILLKPQVELETDSLVAYLSFSLPTTPHDSIPIFIRPDWDDKITDVPGGCATETGAYRRILLTWLGKVGPYLYHSLNAHRVRIMDSFTHYHPIDGGFDEFYLVQMAMPGAKLISSPYTDQIENFKDLSKAEASSLLTETPLEVGDLIYIPRGVVHRGVGGVLAQVITIPGFKPGAEIGVDYHLRKLNQHLGLTGSDTLAYNTEASDRIVIK